MTPTLYVTNWSSRGMHGPGRRWTIITRPRGSHYGEGRVDILRPDPTAVDDFASGFLTFRNFRAEYIEALMPILSDLAPGNLHAYSGHVGREIVTMVADGDTLCCACPQDEAAAGRCHRVWAAELLRRAGWRVILDGRELFGVDTDWRPVWAGDPGARV